MKAQIITTCSLLITLLNVPVTLQAKRMFYEATARTKQQLSHYGYTSQEKEWELKSKKGLYSYRARIYDAKLRKFLSPDRAQEQSGSYTYVYNNPISFIDLSGNQGELFEELFTVLNRPKGLQKTGLLDTHGTQLLSSFKIPTNIKITFLTRANTAVLSSAGSTYNLWRHFGAKEYDPSVYISSKLPARYKFMSRSSVNGGVVTHESYNVSKFLKEGKIDRDLTTEFIPISHGPGDVIRDLSLASLSLDEIASRKTNFQRRLMVGKGKDIKYKKAKYLVNTRMQWFTVKQPQKLSEVIDIISQHFSEGGKRGAMHIIVTSCRGYSYDNSLKFAYGDSDFNVFAPTLKGDENIGIKLNEKRKRLNPLSDKYWPTKKAIKKDGSLVSFVS